MELHEYLKKNLNEMRDIQHFFLDYIDAESEENTIFKELIDKYENSDISKKRDTIKDFLYLISNVANNHRSPNLFQRIGQLILHLKKQIEENFSSTDLLAIFKKNKRIILFLLKENILKPDKKISNLIINLNYQNFFYPEFKEFYPDEIKKQIEEEINGIEDFDERRLIGENDNYICQLIRQDSVEEFISFVSRTNYSLLSEVPPSIFETNPFLLKHKPTLIEYTAFYGSIQIFKYLDFNKVSIKSTWLYAVHSSNPELLHFIEEDSSTPNENFFRESIKCFYSNIAEYIKDIFGDKLPLSSFHTLCPSLKYHNYQYMPDIYDSNYTPYFLIKYDYADLVKEYIKSDKLTFENELNTSLVGQISIQNQ